MKKVNKNVVKKVVKKEVKKKVLNMGSKGGKGKGIGVFIKNCIIDMMIEGDLNYKKIDELCFDKFGSDINGKESRINSIRWHMNDLKNFKEWNGVELVWDEIVVE